MATKRKLLHIISSLQRGGAETLLVMLIKQLTSYEHHVCYFHDGPLRASLEEAAVPVTHIKGFLAPYDPLGFYRLYKSVQRIKPDLIHTSLWAANMMGPYVAAFWSIPVISSFHALCEHEGRLRTFIARWCARKPACCIAVCQGVARSITAAGRAHKGEIAVISNGIDTYALTQRARRPIAMHKDTVFTFGTVGRFVPVKKYDVLLESFSQLVKKHQNIRLILVGSGPQEAALRNQAKVLGIEHNVLFVVNEEAAPYYQLFDCFVQPSLYEGLSLALLESMALGIPVVATSPDGFHEVIMHGYNGLLVQPNDVEGLTAVLATMLSDASMRYALKIAGKSTVEERFTLRKAALSYERVIQALLSL